MNKKQIVPHLSTIKCPHIKNSWEQRDGGIVQEKDGTVRQLCTKCYVIYKQQKQEERENEQ